MRRRFRPTWRWASTSSRSRRRSELGGHPRLPGAADRERWVVLSHPYGADGEQSPRWEALRLAVDGTLERPGVTFDAGRALMGTFVFTPDGEVAISVHEDGSLGVVSFAGAEPEVLQAHVAGAFYAEAVALDPAGDAAWILDPNWRKNGGALYRARTPARRERAWSSSAGGTAV